MGGNDKENEKKKKKNGEEASSPKLEAVVQGIITKYHSIAQKLRRSGYKARKRVAAALF